MNQSRNESVVLVCLRVDSVEVFLKVSSSSSQVAEALTMGLKLVCREHRHATYYSLKSETSWRFSSSHTCHRVSQRYPSNLCICPPVKLQPVSHTDADVAWPSQWIKEVRGHRNVRGRPATPDWNTTERLCLRAADARGVRKRTRGSLSLTSH